MRYDVGAIFFIIILLLIWKLSLVEIETSMKVMLSIAALGASLFGAWYADRD